MNDITLYHDEQLGGTCGGSGPPLLAYLIFLSHLHDDHVIANALEGVIRRALLDGLKEVIDQLETPPPG